MSGCHIPLVGRWGNQLFQWCYAKAYAEQNGLELHTPRWVGEKIFQIEPTPEKQPDDLILGGYCQNQSSLIYTRKQAKEWFKFGPEIQQMLNPHHASNWRTIHCHRRVGDYVGYGYPVVSFESYHKALLKFGFTEMDWENDCHIIAEEDRKYDSRFESVGLPFLPDFYRLMTSPVLFRANSSFSYWAATLGNGRVFSPIIDGLEGGKEHDCKFVEGNWPKLSQMVDCTDLHLSEE